MVAFSDVSGTKKVVFGRVREFPRLEFSGTGMPGNFPTRIFRESNMPSISRLEIFGNRVAKIRELFSFENSYC